MINIDTKRNIMLAYVDDGIKVPWRYLLSAFAESGCVSLCVLNAMEHYSNMDTARISAYHAVKKTGMEYDIVVTEYDIFICDLKKVA